MKTLALLFAALTLPASAFAGKTIDAKDFCQKVVQAAKSCDGKKGPGCIMAVLRKQKVVGEDSHINAAADAGPNLKRASFKDTLANSTDIFDSPEDVDDGSLIVFGRQGGRSCPGGKAYGQLGVKCNGDQVFTINNGKIQKVPIGRVFKEKGCVTGVYTNPNIKAGGGSSSAAPADGQN